MEYENVSRTGFGLTAKHIFARFPKINLIVIFSLPKYWRPNCQPSSNPSAEGAGSGCQ